MNAWHVATREIIRRPIPFLAGVLAVIVAAAVLIGQTASLGYLPDVAADALWRAGFLYASEGAMPESRATFLRLADTFPDHELATDGLFRAASAALNAGDTVGAESLYGRLAATASGVYWASSSA